MTARQFINEWQEQVRQHNELCPVGERLEDAALLTMFKATLIGTTCLGDIEQNAGIFRIMNPGAGDIPYNTYVNLALQSAELYDQTRIN